MTEPSNASQDTASPESTSGNDLPAAIVSPARPAWWAWLIPAAALVVVIFLFSTYVIKSGSIITVELEDGHGLKAGDVLRCRGIVVGEVERVVLDQELDGVVVTVRLQADAEDIARAGSRFWVVRPTLSLTEVGGLETITGPHYLTVLPGSGEPQSQFVALAKPPVLAGKDPQGLEIELSADRRGSLSVGAPISYRQIQIGMVLSVGLASDAATVNVRLYIEPRYTYLVRANSVFWNVSGANIDLSFGGFSYKVDSLAALIKGGVAMATPQTPGATVTTGHRFALQEKANKEWLTWRPNLPVGAALLPPGTRQPKMVRITVSRMQRRILKRTRRYSGWVLPVAGGVLGPATLLATGEAKENAQLEVAGQRVGMASLESERRGPLIHLKLKLTDAEPWTQQSGGYRALTEPIHCLILTDGTGTPMAIDAGRLISHDGGWQIDKAIAFEPGMHGAAVVARSDGVLVGILSVTDGSGTILSVDLP
jgi:hypothetical protein